MGISVVMIISLEKKIVLVFFLVVFWIRFIFDILLNMGIFIFFVFWLRVMNIFFIIIIVLFIMILKLIVFIESRLVDIFIMCK